jgi:hypothetical protein
MSLGQRRSSVNPLTSLYAKVVLLGPFFEESRIKTTPHLLVSFKTDGQWSGIHNLAEENFAEYTRNPLRYQKLRYCDYERFLSRQLSQQIGYREFNEVKDLRIFRELNQYLLQERIGIPIDSLHIVYGLNTYDPVNAISTMDTLFTYTYNPNAVAHAKRY